MNCPYCNNPIPQNANNCPGCGAPVQQQQTQPQPQGMNQNQFQPQQQQQQNVVNPKSPFLAELLSCLIVGVGQMYNGQVAKGVVLLIATAIIGSATFGIGYFILWLIAIIDAGKIARKINAGKVVGDWEFF